MPCCFVRIHVGLETMPSKCPRHSTTYEPVQICLKCHSKLGNGCFTILFNGAYFLLADMEEGDESSRLRMVN